MGQPVQNGDYCHSGQNHNGDLQARLQEKCSVSRLSNREKMEWKCSYTSILSSNWPVRVWAPYSILCIRIHPGCARRGWRLERDK